ncbi:MAG TPA: hypothetical protein VOA87_00895 [Thermoanaerobaculia bacterium]|nr:hypothetical protein [Thermoanaerobaculia bacterium]
MWQYRDTWYFGGGGLLFLFTEPDARGKGLGVLFEVMAAFAFLLARREGRKKGWTLTLTQKPEPYANLQAAMERLNETEDKAAPSPQLK